MLQLWRCLIIMLIIKKHVLTGDIWTTKKILTSFSFMTAQAV